MFKLTEMTTKKIHFDVAMARYNPLKSCNWTTYPNNYPDVHFAVCALRTKK